MWVQAAKRSDGERAVKATGISKNMRNPYFRCTKYGICNQGTNVTHLFSLAAAPRRNMSIVCPTSFMHGSRKDFWATCATLLIAPLAWRATSRLALLFLTCKLRQPLGWCQGCRTAERWGTKLSSGFTQFPVIQPTNWCAHSLWPSERKVPFF